MATSKKEGSSEIPAYLNISKFIVYFTYVVIIFGEIMLAFRIFFLLFSANPTTPFVEFVYKTSTDFLAPFRAIFPTKPVGETGYLDVASLFALIFYLILAQLIKALIGYIDKKIKQHESLDELIEKDQKARL